MAIIKPNATAPQGLNPDEIEAKKGALQTIGTATPQAPATSSAPQARPQQGSGRFTNIQKYVQANSGAGQRIAGNIQNQFDKNAQGVSQGIQQAQQQLEQKVNPLQQQLGEQGSQQLRAGFVDPNAVLQDQAKLGDFRNLQQGMGTNIANVQGTEQLRQQQLQAQAAGLAQTADLAGSEQGRFQLLRSALGSPGNAYSQGSQRLDQVLLQSQPNVSRNLQAGLRGTVNQQRTGLSTLEQDRQNKINALRDLSGQRKSEWQNLLEGGTSQGLESDIKQRGLGDIKTSAEQALESAKYDVNANLPALRQRLAENKINASDAERLGLKQGTNIYDVDLSKYITQGSKDPNLTTAANADEVKRYNALRQLAGQDQLGGGIFGPQDQAGTFKAYEMNQTGLNQDIANRQSLYTKTQPANIAQNMINTVNSYLGGGGSGMRGRRYFQGELTDMANELAAAQGSASPIEAMNAAVNKFTQRTGNTGYRDMFTPEYNRIQAQLGRTLGVADLPATAPGQVASLPTNNLGVSDFTQLPGLEGWTPPNNKYEEAPPNPANMLPDKKG